MISPQTDLLIQAGANVKVATREGATPLSLACQNGNAAIVETLLKAGADPNEKLPTARPPLMMASRTGNLATMKALLDRGADVNAKETIRGTSALMWAADQGHAARRQAADRSRRGHEGRLEPRPRGRRTREIRRSAKGKRANGSEQVRIAPLRRRRAARRQPHNAPATSSAAPPPREAQQNQDLSGGALTPLVFAVRANSLETVKDVARGRRRHRSDHRLRLDAAARGVAEPVLSARLVPAGQGADVNIANNGGWTPLYLAVDNRNIEGGDYPVRKGDMDHLAFIKKLLDKGADVNARMKDSTGDRTVFTNQWLDENGATAFLRASQSSDLEVMRLLLAHGADPKIATDGDVTALQVAAGIGWVDGLTYEWSRKGERRSGEAAPRPGCRSERPGG